MNQTINIGSLLERILELLLDWSYLKGGRDDGPRLCFSLKDMAELDDPPDDLGSYFGKGIRVNDCRLEIVSQVAGILQCVANILVEGLDSGHLGCICQRLAGQVRLVQESHLCG